MVGVTFLVSASGCCCCVGTLNMPRHGTGNSLTSPALASLLSELWLDAAPNVPLKGSAQAVLAHAALRRMQFMMMMLDGSEEASLL